MQPIQHTFAHLLIIVHTDAYYCTYNFLLLHTNALYCTLLYTSSNCCILLHSPESELAAPLHDSDSSGGRGSSRRDGEGGEGREGREGTPLRSSVSPPLRHRSRWVTFVFGLGKVVDQGCPKPGKEGTNKSWRIWTKPNKLGKIGLKASIYRQKRAKLGKKN